MRRYRQRTDRTSHADQEGRDLTEVEHMLVQVCHNSVIDAD